MKIKVIITLIIIAQALALDAQKRYYTKTGVISFKAGTAVEDIDAVNKSVSSIIDIVSGQVEVAVLIKGFEFRRGLMQEHFNENYLESEKFPKATFKGKIDNISQLDFKKDGQYALMAKGTLEIHGVKHEVSVPVAITIVSSQLSADAAFQVRLEDYKVEIPGAVKDKISPAVSIKVAGDYKAL
jgi:polyisoprenoid-binding protein YceI